MTDDTRWLDEEEQHAWRVYLRGTALVMETLDRDLQQHGVSLSEYEILALISESPERHQRMSTLAAAVVQSRSRLTHTAARLERRGWVQRRQSPHDKRGVELCLTEEGYAVVARLAPIHVAGVRRVLMGPLGRRSFLRLGALLDTVANGPAGAE
ncbi:MAG: MarR family transcriptional regulator [Actinobacteria bacterium]|nr:MarR family transcriptional regulator [Actinomycetota bacterium]